MDREENLRHWEKWAGEYGTELRATTKCVSIKRLEIEALLRHIDANAEVTLLEIGCGNGANGFALVSRHERLRYVGLDFSPTMIANAAAVAKRRLDAGDRGSERMAFGVADARQLSVPLALDASQPTFVGTAMSFPIGAVDVVFTDRMLINLSSAGEQLAVMDRISQVLQAGKRFLMIENSVQTHAALNGVRAALGLPPRPTASYNVFIDEATVIAPFREKMTLEGIEDFSALHDLVLYAVEPAATDGEVHYDSPLMTRLTDAALHLAEHGLGAGAFGQNRLWVWRK